MKLLENNEPYKLMCANKNEVALESIPRRAGIFFYMNTFTNLNKNVYNLSLTIEVEIPWKKVSVEGSRSDGIIKTSDTSHPQKINHTYKGIIHYGDTNS